MRLRNRHTAAAALVLASIVLVGCESGRTRPPQVTVQVVHAAPERGEIQLRRIQREEARLDYREASARLRFDVDEYDFNAYIARPGTSSDWTLLGTFTVSLTQDSDYLFVLTEPNGTFEPIVVETPVVSQSDESRIVAVHAAPSLGPMSVYLEPADIDPTGVAPLGTLSFGETIDDGTRAPGDYRLVLTEAGNPENVLMTSAEFELVGGVPHSFTIVDPAGDSIAPISVVVTGAERGVLYDESVRALAHVINGAADGEPRDIYVGEDLSETLVAGAPALTEVLADLPTGEQTFSVTPAGNTGVVEAETETTIGVTRHYTFLITGEAGELRLTSTLDDRRVLAEHARLRVLNVANRLEPVEIFVLPPDSDLTDLRSPDVTLTVPGASQRMNLPIGEYDLVFRDRETEDIVAGPLRVSLGEGIYTLLIANGATPDSAEIIYIDGFE